MKTATYTKPLTIAFPEETFRRIKSITDHERISMGEWVRNAVTKALTEENNTNSKEKK